MGTHYKHLTMDERNTFHRRRLEGASLRAIARDLARPASTVAREIARNQPAASYDAATAAGGYHRRRRHGNPKLAPEMPLWRAVVMDLYRGWSPEQIAGRRRRMHPNEPAQRVSHETIYLALYALPRGELRTALLAQLRQGHKTRRPRGRGQDRRGGLKNRTSIHERPAEVANRQFLWACIPMPTVFGPIESDDYKNGGHEYMPTLPGFAAPCCDCAW